MSDSSELELSTTPSASPPNPSGGDDVFSAEPVPEPLLRFSIQRLMVMTAVLAAQFALIGRFGLAGVMGGIVLFAFMMFVVACWGELERFRGRVGIGLRFEQRTSNGAMGFFTVMVVVGAIAAVSQLSFQLIYARYLEVRLETRLGFEAQTTFVRRDPGKQSRLWQLRLLRNGSPLAQAGAKLGDVIVTDLSPNEFLRALDQNRGSTMDITLATAVPSLAIDERPQRTVTLDLTKH